MNESQEIRSVIDSLTEIEESAHKVNAKDPKDVRGMAPKVNKDGERDYSNPKGQSYAERKGFTG